MATVTTIVPEFDAWVADGRALAHQRRNVDWQLADWMVSGKERGFIDQGGFDFLADSLGMAPKRLRDISRAAEAFPAHMRDSALSIEHHASVATLPKQEAFALLGEAKAQRWTPERVRHEAHIITSDGDAPARARDTDGQLQSFLAHWNRLPRTIRLEAAELIATSNGDEIEP